MKTSMYLFCLAALAGCGQAKQSQGFTVEGKIKGVGAGIVRLTAYDEETRTSKVLDSSTVRDGAFRLTGSMPSPAMVSVSIGDYWSLSLFLENSKISIDADTSDAQHYDYTAYGAGKGAQLNRFTVSGSANQDHWKSFENNPRLKLYEPQLKVLGEAYTKAPNKEEGYKIKELLDSIGDLAMAARKKLIDSFVTASPSSPASAYMFYDYYRFNEAMPLADMESLVSKFSGPAQSTVYFKELSKSLEKKKSL